MRDLHSRLTEIVVSAKAIADVAERRGQVTLEDLKDICGLVQDLADISSEVANQTGAE